MADLHNLNALTLARRFDDPAWRHAALRAIAGAIPAGRWRVGLPAVLGLVDQPGGVRGGDGRARRARHSRS